MSQLGAMLFSGYVLEYVYLFVLYVYCPCPLINIKVVKYVFEHKFTWVAFKT